MRKYYQFLYMFLITIITGGVFLIGCGGGGSSSGGNNNSTCAYYSDYCGASNRNLGCCSGQGSCMGGGLFTPWRCQ